MSAPLDVLTSAEEMTVTYALLHLGRSDVGESLKWTCVDVLRKIGHPIAADDLEVEIRRGHSVKA